jgi:hypothetical protein
MNSDMGRRAVNADDSTPIHTGIFSVHLHEHPLRRCSQCRVPCSKTEPPRDCSSTSDIRGITPLLARSRPHQAWWLPPLIVVTECAPIICLTSTAKHAPNRRCSRKLTFSRAYPHPRAEPCKMVLFANVSLTFASSPRRKK